MKTATKAVSAAVRTEIVQMRMSPSEKLALMGLARRLGHRNNLSAAMRQVLTQAMQDSTAQTPAQAR